MRNMLLLTAILAALILASGLYVFYQLAIIPVLSAIGG
jgi:hypothetical protein